MPFEALLEYRAERDAMVVRIRQVLEADHRVRAAWLWGSCGRGTADELSDLDVWVVVDDRSIDSVAAQRHGYAAQVGTPLAAVEAPQNAPERGAYLHAVYPGASAPHAVDWYWQAESAAQVPTDTQILFERVTLPRTEAGPSFPGAPGPPRTRLEQVTHAIHFFWAMLLVVAKQAARFPNEPEFKLLALVQEPVLEAQAFVGPGQKVYPQRRHGSYGQPLDKLAHLRRLVAAMETMMPEVAARGAEIPRAEIVSQVRGYLDLAEAKAQSLIAGAQGPAIAGRD